MTALGRLVEDLGRTAHEGCLVLVAGGPPPSWRDCALGVLVLIACYAITLSVRLVLP